MVRHRGATLLPGLIDAHVHLRGTGDLEELVRWGVTTALDMGSWPPALIEELRRARRTDVRSTGAGAVGPGSPLARIPGRPGDSIVTKPEDGRRFVAARVAEGVDYIKVIVDPPGRGGPDQATVAAIVQAAHDAGRMVVAHASNTGAVATAQAAGADVLTHAPLDAALDDAAVAEVVRSRRTSVPTLVMMEGVAANAPVPGLDYRHARDSVAALHRAGVPIVLGTDANQAPGVPANVPYGESVHRELELLVEAGLTPAQALHAATGAAADRFGLPDRGRIAPGLRSDLLLVGGDPITDITSTRAILAVRLAQAAEGAGA
jgi:imidazolonepropionase-like amidohydrolase